MSRPRPPHEQNVAMAPVDPTSFDNNVDVGFELQQYANIIQFCESVLSGRHESVRPDLAFEADFRGDQTIANRVELQLRRYKIERQLKYDFESRRSAKPAKFERPPYFDLSNVLSQALALTQATNQAIIEHGSTAVNEAAGDSHDDNTFYSSVFETPDSNSTSAGRKQSAIEEHYSPALNRDDDASFDTAGSSNDSRSAGGGTRQHIDQLSTVRPRQGHTGTNHTFTVPGLTTVNQSQMSGSLPNTNSYITMHPPSPLLGGNESPLPRPPVATLAQPTALRDNLSSGASADTSSQNTVHLKGKKTKRPKKKRKAEDHIVTERPLFIKPEPRSPSPITGPSLRAPKRLRQSRNETHVETPVEKDHAGSASGPPNNQQPMQRTPSGYDPTRPLLPPESRFLRQPVEREWMSLDPSDGRSGGFIDRERYISRETGHMPSSHYTGDLAHYQPAAHEQVRYAMPSGTRYFYESAPTRIYVDANGREYIDPPRQVGHQSPTPRNHHGDTQPYYAPVAPSVPNRQRGTEHDSVLYARPPSPYVSTRRIITEPERLLQEQPGYRFREYTGHPESQSEQFVELVAHHNRTPVVDSRRAYIRRATSMMPMEAGPYERTNTLVSEQPHQYSDDHRVFTRGQLRPSYVSTTYSGLPEPLRAEPGANAAHVEGFTITPGAAQTGDLAHGSRRANDGRVGVYTDSTGREVVYR